MIPVTKPFLPPLKEYKDYIDQIWNRNWLTNNGPLVNQLELNLKNSLGLKHLLFVGNGTIAIQMAIKALELSGEIITTPFSYVATTSSIVWENCKPVFVDIDVNNFNINHKLIEKAITDKTSAILATHVFGNPCNIDEIEGIANRHNLKVIYDAAHCYGVKYKGKSIFNFGDISTVSFHATKLFHTIEGGAVIAQHPSYLSRLASLRNFGHDGPAKFSSVGINGKNSEFHAAMGLCNLNYIDDLMTKRKEQYNYYKYKLENLNCKFQSINLHADYNYAYMPIIFSYEEVLIKSLNYLKRHEIFPRRYFYPSLSKLSYVDVYDTPVSDGISKCVLCLPLYNDLSKEEIDMIARHLLRIQNYY